MSVIRRDGEWVSVPGEDIDLSSLEPAVKRQLWRGIQKKNPDLADFLRSQKSDPTVQALQECFGVSVCITTPEFEEYMQAGAE